MKISECPFSVGDIAVPIFVPIEPVGERPNKRPSRAIKEVRNHTVKTIADGSQNSSESSCRLTFEETGSAVFASCYFRKKT